MYKGKSKDDAGIIFAPYIVVTQKDIEQMSEVEQEQLEKGRQEYRNKMAEYNRRHEVCPKCGSDHYTTTLMGCIMTDLETHKDTNYVTCSKCGWKGIRHEMVERSNMKIDFDDYYMTMAYLVAMKSKDESTHVGAVVVGPDKEVRSTGYNSFPRGINDNLPERQQRPEKYLWFEHAERNAIYNSSLMGVSLKGCKMYTNGIPCMDCARAIVQAGIKEVIVDLVWDKNNYGNWIEQAKKTRILFEEAGVTLRFWEGKFLNIERYRNGTTIA